MNEQDRNSTQIPAGTSLDDAAPSQSNYLSKEDVDPPILVQIAYMTSDEVESNGVKNTVGVLNFNGDVKPMILKPTNREILKAITGATTVEQLRGVQIVLYNDPTIAFQGKLTGGIRIRAAQAAPAEPVSYVPGAGLGDAAAPPMPGSGEPFDDDIPFG